MKNKNYILWIIGAVLLFLLLKPIIKKTALIDQVAYNGDMEHWCIRAPTDVGNGYGFLDGTTTRCDAANSAPYLNPVYNGLNQCNEIPTMWWQKYGCCPLRTTDAHSGQYAVIVHKAQTDDWEFFGMTTTGTSQSFLPAYPDRTYNLSVYYKFTLNTPSETRVRIDLSFYEQNLPEITNYNIGAGISF